LFQEVAAVDEVVQASSLSRAVPSTTYMTLKKDPLWERLPLEFRKDIQETYEKVWDCQSEMVVARAQTARMTPLAVQLVRKEADDQAFVRQAAQSPPPTPKTGTFQRREAQVDRSVPAAPRVTPGGIVWQIKDWLAYPGNIAALDQEWSESEFLFLTDSGLDRWDLRVTRDDLRRAKLSLDQFMANLNQNIESQGRIQSFRMHCRAAIPMTAALKKQLEELAR
jgi:hypothetical protein